jgi:actin-related protein
MEKYLDYLITGKLKESLSDSPLMMVESPMQTREFRLKLVELVFEKFEGCGFNLHKSALLTSYLYSKENSFVIDIGANFTHITPVFEGFPVSKCSPSMTQRASRLSAGDSS